MKNLIKRNIGKIILSLSFFVLLIGGICYYCIQEIPDNYYLFKGQKVDFNTLYPVTSTVSEKTDQSYEIDVKIMGIIPVKKVDVKVLEDTQVVAGGQSFGVKFYTQGVIIVGMSDVISENGAINPAYNGGARIGDIIVSINNRKVTSNETLSEIVNEIGDKEITILLVRRNLEFSITLTPEKEKESGEYKIGLWVRDSTAGIGTITYYDPVNKTFAGLGHSICDVDTGEIMPLASAQVVGVEITDVKKSESGLPGELKGVFDEKNVIGSLYTNVEAGIYGSLSDSYKLYGNPINIAFKQDIKEGHATILCNVGKGAKEYNIEITKINRASTQKTKNMVIKVTDPELLDITGGIVQGMSGSPIIQEGKLIGAVTHVLINSPTEGFGIFIENMLAN